MSCCLILQQNNRIFMGADTAISTIVDGEFYRVSNDQQKIFPILDALVFCSGNIDLVENILVYIKSLDVLDVRLVSKYLKGIAPSKENGIYNVEIIIALSGSELYQLSEYNDFDIVRIENPEDKIRILSGGIRTEDCLDFAEAELKASTDVLQTYENVYQKLSSESIGGNLVVWEISNEIKFHCYKPIAEKDIKYIASCGDMLIVADEIKGRILAGNQLTVADENNQFVLDAAGLRMTNAKFEVIGNDDKNKVILNPNDGIQVQKLVGNDFVSQFYVDNAGNLNFTGDISGVSGTFSGFISAIGGNLGGWTISADGLRDNRGNYILSNGKVRLGALYINGNEFIFSGDFYADNLYGELNTFQFGNWTMTNSKFGSISADKITTGTFLADRIFGGTIRWPGVSMGTTETGISKINADKGIDLVVGETVINAREKIINLSATEDIVFGDHTKRPNINIKGHLITNGPSGPERGLTESHGVGGKSAIKILKFTNGIFTGMAKVTDPAAGLGSLSWDKPTYPPVDVLNDPLYSGDYYLLTGMIAEVGDIVTIEYFGDYEQAYTEVSTGRDRIDLYDAWNYATYNSISPAVNPPPLTWETATNITQFPVFWPRLIDVNGRTDPDDTYDDYEPFYSPYFDSYETYNSSHHYFVGPQIISQDGAPKGCELGIWQIFTSNLQDYTNSIEDVNQADRTIYIRVIVTEGVQDTEIWEQDVVFPDDVVAWTDKGAYILTDLDFMHEDELDLEVSGTLHYRTSGSEFYYAFDAVRRAVLADEPATFDQVSGVVDSVYTGNTFASRKNGNVYMGMYNGSLMVNGVYPRMAGEEKTQYEYPDGLPNPGAYRPDHEYVYTTSENIYWDDEFDPPPTNYAAYFNVGDMSNLTFLADNSLHIKVTRRRWVRP